MSGGHLRILPGKFEEQVAAAGGKGVFPLISGGTPFVLRATSLVFVDGQITDFAYTGVGTTTINFVPNLIQGAILTVKE